MSHEPDTTAMSETHINTGKQEPNLVERPIKELQVDISNRHKNRVTVLEIGEKELVKTIFDHTVRNINLSALMQQTNLLSDCRGNVAQMKLKCQLRVKSNAKQFQ